MSYAKKVMKRAVKADKRSNNNSVSSTKRKASKKKVKKT